jgi:dipeptidase E
MPGNSMAEAEQLAAGISGPAYAMDDETAIKVVDGTFEVVSEGHWKQFPAQLPTPTASERGALS